MFLRPIFLGIIQRVFKKTLYFFFFLFLLWLAVNYFFYFFGFYSSSLAIVSGGYDNTNFFVPEEIKFYDNGKLIGSLYYDRDNEKVIKTGILPQKPVNVYYEYRPFNRFLYDQVTFNYTEIEKQKEFFLILEREYSRRNYLAKQEAVQNKGELKIDGDQIIIAKELFLEPSAAAGKKESVSRTEQDFRNVRVVSLGQETENTRLQESSPVERSSGRIIRSGYTEETKRLGVSVPQRPVDRVLNDNGTDQQKNENLERSVYRRYHDNGNLYLEAEMSGNLPDGFTKIYYENGNIKALIIFKEGKKDGVCKTYYPSGNIENEIECRNDIIVHKKTYDETGRVILSW